MGKGNGHMCKITRHGDKISENKRHLLNMDCAKNYSKLKTHRPYKKVERHVAGRGMIRQA